MVIVTPSTEFLSEAEIGDLERVRSEQNADYAGRAISGAGRVALGFAGAMLVFAAVLLVITIFGDPALINEITTDVFLSLFGAGLLASFFMFRGRR